MNRSKITAPHWSDDEDMDDLEKVTEELQHPQPDDTKDILCKMDAIPELYRHNDSSSTSYPHCFKSDPISPASARRALVLQVLMKELAEIVTSYLCPIQGFKIQTIQGPLDQHALDIFDRGEGEVVITWQEEFSIHFASDGRLLHRNQPGQDSAWEIGLGNYMTLTRSILPSEKTFTFQLKTFDSKTLEETKSERLFNANQANFRSGVAMDQEVYLFSDIARVGDPVRSDARSHRIDCRKLGRWKTFTVFGHATKAQMAVVDGRIYLPTRTSISSYTTDGCDPRRILCSRVRQVIPNFNPVHIAISPDFFYISHHYEAPDQPPENLIVILVRKTGALWDFWGDESLTHISKLTLIGDSLWVCDGDRVVLFR